MPIASPQVFAEAERLQREVLDAIFGAQPLAAGMAAAAPASPTAVIPVQSNIVGVGYGARMASGAATDELAVRVYVRAKLPLSAVGQAERVPPTVNGTPTDVIAVGDVAAHARPVSCGVSIGHHLITAGTLGCRIALNGTAGEFLLSNNHVLANSSDVGPGAVGGPAAVGDDILEPGPIDGGAANPRIASLHDWEPLDFAGIPNTIDAAVAAIATPGDVLPPLLTIGAAVLPPQPAALYQSVRKHGRTTAHTVGVILDLAANIKVRYGTRIAHFRNQLGIQGVGAVPFSDGGDSGSLIVDAVGRQPVGLLFAGGSGITFANYIAPVLTRFGASIV
jgi:hypothetical protein